MSIVSERSSQISQQVARRIAAGEERIDRAVAQASAKVSAAADRAHERLDQLILSKPTTHNVVTYHTGAEESFQALLSSITEAKRSFHIETFIWHDDDTGMQVAQALVKRVQDAAAKGETFDAKVLIDSFGSKFDIGLHFSLGASKVLKYLRDNGVEVRTFNSHWVSLKTLGMPITHRKIYIADSDRYLVGGRNIGDEYLKHTFQLRRNDPSSELKSWHDFLMTVRGDEAARVQDEFYKNWGRSGGTVPAGPTRPIPAPDGHTAVQTYVTDPLSRELGIRDVHLKAIAAARREIFVISPYIGDDELLDALVAAKTRNTTRRSELLASCKTIAERKQIDERLPELKLRVLLPADGSEGRDMTIEMAYATARRLLQAGAEVRFTRGGVEAGQAVERYSHFKGFMIDQKVLSVGSANADYRTFHSNHEIVNLVADPGKVGEFDRTVARPDWEAAMPVDLAYLDQHSTPVQRAKQWLGSTLSFLY